LAGGRTAAGTPGRGRAAAGGPVGAIHGTGHEEAAIAGGEPLMRIRHKQPQLVSMWMLDVFCCALGCVTLLFLLNSRMASDEAAANKTALIDLESTRRELALALTDVKGLKIQLESENTQFTKQLAAIRIEKDELAKRLGLARDE